jgi:cysteine desulfurase/selenocysteine lyase
LNSELLNITFDVEKIRQDFPILSRNIGDKRLVYLDNAATTQKPNLVIDSIKNYYENYNSNIHRGVHTLSQLATEAVEDARVKVQKFINAKSNSEVIFTKGATDSINLLAYSLAGDLIKSGDEIIITTMEHHANIVPWQMISKKFGIKLKVVNISEEGELDYEHLASLITEKTKLISFVHVSNTLGSVNDVNRIVELAKSYGIMTILDASQSIQHIPIDVQKLDVDFLVFSGHKVYAPTGIGVLFGKENLLDIMPPYQGGGDMILSVSFEETIYNELPFKFEAGTINIEGAIGLGYAIDYLNFIGINNINTYENELTKYTTTKLLEISEIQLIGTSKSKVSVNSFVVKDIHPHDIGSMLDSYGVAVRTGHHCTEPIMRRYKIPATTRASVSFYNTKDEIDILCNSLKEIIKFFA